MEKLNKRIMSGLLAGTLTFGTMPALQSVANAKDDDVIIITEENAANMDLVEVCHMKGIYNVIVNNVPVYVYLNNKVDNQYLLKNDAVELAKQEYNTNKVYFYSKVVKSPNYVEGFSPAEEEFNFVYALSDKSSVKGWTRVQNTSVITDGELVASSIGLGEFLLKEVDLSRFFRPTEDPFYSNAGFGYADINHDGVLSEIIYVGNDESNMLLDKFNATIRVNESKGKVKVYKAWMNDRTVFALSSKNPGNGWKLSGLNEVNDNILIGTSPEFMEALYHVASTTVTTEQLYFPKIDNGINQVIDEPVLSNSNVNMLSKNDAINWASNTYTSSNVQFCILQREYVDKNTGLATKVYAISTQLYVDGYDFAFDDLIPNNAMICLSVQDAENYVALYGKSATKALK